MAYTNDSTTQGQNDSTEQQQLATSQRSEQRVSQNVQDSMRQNEEQGLWTQAPADQSASDVATGGKKSLYTDSSLPSSLSASGSLSDTSAASGGSSFGVNDLTSANSFLTDSQQLLASLNNLSGLESSSNNQQLETDATNLANAVQQFSTDFMQGEGQASNGTASAESGWQHGHQEDGGGDTGSKGWRREHHHSSGSDGRAAAGTDAGTGTGAGTNTGTDAGTSSSTATGTDTGTSSSTTTGTDTGTSSSTTTGTDTGTSSSTITGTDTGSGSGSSTTNTAGLYVQGNQLMDDGQPFVVNGINDTTSTEHNELTNELPALAASGVNTVRIMMQASDMEAGANGAANQEVQAALNAGLKVDIAYNSDEAIYGNTGGILSSSDLSEAQQALTTEAAEWGNNADVMYNVTNESGETNDATNSTLLSNTTALIQAVQTGAKEANPDANPVTVVDDSEWGQAGYDSNYQGQSFILNNIGALEAAGNGQVVAAEHNYQSGASYTNAGLEAIQSAGMPVINEEMGYNTSSFNLAEQISPVTGEPFGGMVWNDGTDPNTGNFYNNITNQSDLYPAVQQFWQTVNQETT